MKKFFLAVALLALLLLCSCASEADKANYNISKQADYFESERKITVYNARTDTVILEAEGYMSISNNSNNELVCTVKIGPDTYRKNYIYLNLRAIILPAKLGSATADDLNEILANMLENQQKTADKE